MTEIKMQNKILEIKQAAKLVENRREEFANVMDEILEETVSFKNEVKAVIGEISLDEARKAMINFFIEKMEQIKWRDK